MQHHKGASSTHSPRSQMNIFDATNVQPIFDPTHSYHCSSDLTQALTAAHVSQGMDPLQAVLQAQLQAPLIEPFLF